MQSHSLIKKAAGKHYDSSTDLPSYMSFALLAVAIWPAFGQILRFPARNLHLQRSFVQELRMMLPSSKDVCPMYSFGSSSCLSTLIKYIKFMTLLHRRLGNGHGSQTCNMQTV